MEYSEWLFALVELADGGGDLLDRFIMLVNWATQASSGRELSHAPWSVDSVRGQRSIGLF